MGNTLNKNFIVMLAGIALAGCETTSVGQGVVQDLSGNAKGSVSFKIEEEFGESQAKVVARFSSGEIYRGKFIVQKTESSTGTDLFNSKTKKTDYMVSDTTSYSSKAAGLLFGPSGKTMSCNMMLASPKSGFGGGGMGQCKLSTGETIPLQFTEEG